MIGDERPTVTWSYDRPASSLRSFSVDLTPLDVPGDSGGGGGLSDYEMLAASLVGFVALLALVISAAMWVA